MRFPTLVARVRAEPVDATAAVVLAVVFVIALLTFRDYGVNWDEPVEAEYGKRLLAYYGSGLTDRSAFSFLNLYYYGGAFDLAGASLDYILPFGHLLTRRLLGAMVGIAGMAIVWRTSRRLGGPVAGLVALVLLATCSPFYGHMFINPKDAPFAVAMAWLLYGLVRAFEQHPRARGGTIAVCGVALGLAVGTRIIGLIGFAYAGIGIVVLWAVESQTIGIKLALVRITHTLLRLVFALPVAYVVMGAVWPWSVLGPYNLIQALDYFGHFREVPWEELYDAKLTSILTMPQSYVPKFLLLQLPEVFSVLALVGAVGAVIATLRGRIHPWRRAALATIVTAALLPIVLAVFGRPALYNGVRHFLFVIPPLAVLGGLSAAFLYERLSSWQKVTAWASAGMFVALLSLPISDLVRLHPYQYVLFNRLAGGVKTANHRYMLDYWGLGLTEAANGLREWIKDAHVPPPSDGKWKVAMCGPAALIPYILGDEFTAHAAMGADFALSMGTYYCADLDAPIVATAERDNVIFARAYDLRGRSIATTMRMHPFRSRAAGEIAD